jgi:ferredoxin
MLECSSGVQANSRLSCQVVITAALDGMHVDLPESQD